MMFRIVKYVLGDILRGRIVLGYAGFLLVASFGLFNLSGDAAKGLIGLLSLVLLVVPLISLVFATIHFYNSYEFIELLAAQPLHRSLLLFAQIIGVTLALSLAVLAGIGLPIVMYSANATGFTLLGASLALTLVFTALAFLGAILARDKARGVGVALLLWFYFVLLHDGLTLYVLFLLENYPLEGVSLALLSLNPVDLTRVLVLLQMDVSALMGYTGAMMKNLLGTGAGIALASAVLAAWVFLPMTLAVWVFRRKDL